jgi:small subunit ribosomal protein S15
MARMHTRRRGSSSSKRPFITQNPAWVPIEPKEIEEIIVKLAKEGQSSAVIGLKLRDQYGVPSVKLAMGKSLMTILKENGLEPKIPEDLVNLIRRVLTVQSHNAKNKKDQKNKKNFQNIEAKIRRLVHYYHSTGRLDKGWKYSIENARLLFE